MHTTINRAGWLVAGVLALFVVAAMTGVVRGGPLDPPGAPSATGTLPQVEPRSPIPPVGWNGVFPIVISQPGSYFFTRSLHGVVQTDGIQITTENVSIDLNGFTLAGASQTGTGIIVVGKQGAIHISNGVVRDWFDGIDGWFDDNNQAVFSRVDHVTAVANAYNGIRLGYESEITDCNASQNYRGVVTHYSVVRGCHVTQNTNIGIYGEVLSLIEDNKVYNNDIGIFTGLGTDTVRFNTSTNNQTSDFSFGGTYNLSDSNVATCPGKVVGTAQTYNPMYQRNIC